MSGGYCPRLNSDYGAANAGACAFPAVVAIYGTAEAIAPYSGESWAPPAERMFTLSQSPTADECQDYARAWSHSETCEGWTLDGNAVCFLKGPLACTPKFGTVDGASAGLVDRAESLLLDFSDMQVGERGDGGRWCRWWRD